MKQFNYKNKTWQDKEVRVGPVINKQGEAVGHWFDYPCDGVSGNQREFTPVITPRITHISDDIPFDNELSQAEAERLAILAEEAAEVIHVIGKILRHGYASQWQKIGVTNRTQLEREVGDLLNIISVMWYNDDINQGKTLQNMQDKADRWMKYTHHQGL